MLCVDGGLGNRMNGQNCEAIACPEVKRGSVAMRAFLLCRDLTLNQVVGHFLFRRGICNETCRSGELSSIELPNIPATKDASNLSLI
jgi:hypothetical protein